MGLSAGWIEATPFGNYVIPGLYLLPMNGIGMLGLVALFWLQRTGQLRLR